MDALDLNSIQKTELLASNAAKDKIMIKPKRTSMRHSRKKSDNSSPSRLSSLEEKALPNLEITKGEQASESPVSTSQEKLFFSYEKPPSSNSEISRSLLTPTDTKDGSRVTSGRKLNVLNFTAAMKEESESMVTSPSSSHTQSAVTPSDVAAATTPTKASTPLSPNTRFLSQETVNIFSSSASQSAHSSTAGVQTDVTTKSTDSGIHAMKSGTNSSSNDKYDNKMSFASSMDVVASSMDVVASSMDVVASSMDVVASSMDVLTEKSNFQNNREHDGSVKNDTKPRMNQFLTPAFAGNKFGPSNASGRLTQKTAESGISGTMTLKEGKKERHWIQNKSTTVASDEWHSLGAEKPNSKIQLSEANPSEMKEQLSLSSSDKTALSSATTTVTPAAVDKKMENVKPVSPSTTAPPAGEPSWRTMMRKKKEICVEDNITKPSEDLVSRSKITTSESKSGLTPDNSLEKKQDSAETFSNKFKNYSEQTLKKAESSESKCQSSDTGVNIGSTKMEHFEIDLLELGSVKASRSLFDSGSKVGSQKDMTTSGKSLTSDRTKLFSGAWSASNKNSAKTVTNDNQDPTDGSTDTLADVKSAASIFGNSKVQSGSMTSQTRGASHKYLPSSSTTSTTNLSSSPSSAATASNQKRTETATASVCGTLGMSPSTYPQSNSSSSSSQVTSADTSPSSLNLKPSYSGYLSKNPTNFSSASKPAGAVSQSNSRTTTATTTSTSNTTPTSVASSIVGVKAFSNASNIRSNPFSHTSSILATSNISNPVSSVAHDVLPSSSSLPVTTTAASSQLSSSFRSSLSSSFKSNISHGPSLHSTPTSATINTPTLKALTKSTEKLPTTEKTINTDRRMENSTKIPAWRENLLKKELKIEIIESSPSSSSLSSNTSSEVLKKSNEKDKSSEISKKTETLSHAETIMQLEKASKVLDMVKNFQNLKSTS